MRRRIKIEINETKEGGGREAGRDGLRDEGKEGGWERRIEREREIKIAKDR
jgi:hypothetical protein